MGMRYGKFSWSSFLRQEPDLSKRQRVKELTEQGLKPRQIALVLGISTQAVYQHLQKLRDAGELREAAS